MAQATRPAVDHDRDLVANQPRGTMMIERARPTAGVSGTLPVDADGRVRYADLFAAQAIYRYPQEK